MPKKQLTEEAQWFLKNLQKLQDDFTGSVGAQIVTTDREGNLVTEMSGQQRACQIIQSTKKGKDQCTNCYKTALSLVKSHKEPVIMMDCYAGFASLWVPIKVKGEIVGSITGCGGRYERRKSEEGLRENYSKLADDLGIEDKEDFLKAAIDEISPVTEEEMKKRAERLAKLVGILAEETALGEAFKVV